MTDMTTDREALLADQLAHQGWRSAEDSAWLVDRKLADGEPYCVECHDWHDADEDHSTFGGW